MPAMQRGNAVIKNWGASYPIGVPSGLAEGDVVYIFVMNYSATALSLSGFTEIVNDNDGGEYLRVFAGTVPSTVPTSYTLTGGTTNDEIVLVAYSGADRTNEVVGAMLSESGVGQSSSPIPGITVTDNGSMVLAFTRNVSAVTGFRSLGEIAVIRTSADEFDSGATGDQTATLSNIWGSVRGVLVSVPTTQNTIATDDFNRADEDPLSDGGNWTNAGFGSLAVVSNAVTNTVSGQWAYSLRTGEALADDQWAEVTTGPMDGGAPAVVLVRAAALAGPWAMRGYAFTIEDGGRSVIHTLLDGSRIELAATEWGYSDRYATHVIRLEAVGTTITGYINGVVALTTTDATNTTGDAGIAIFGTPGPAATLDNFSAGDWTAAGPPPPPPPPSGHIFKIWNGSTWVAAVLKSGAGWPVVSLGNI